MIIELWELKNEEVHGKESLHPRNSINLGIEFNYVLLI